MLSFRQKIFFSYALGFVLFLIILFPLSSFLVSSIVRKAMEARSRELIQRIEHANNDEGLVKTLKDQKALLFFRVSVITDQRKVLYDSHTKRLLGPRFSQEYVVEHPEVLEAMEKKIGYHEDWSDLLGQKFAYMAITFDFHGKQYILRTAFPYRYVSEMQRDFELGFLALACFVLLVSSILSWLILNHFTRPIQRIIQEVRPYQEGVTETLPFIQLKGMTPKDEFSRLAGTLNSLNTQIQKQIDTAKKASNEKEALLQSLIEGVVAVDPNARVTFVNQSALNFFGLVKETLVGHTLQEVHLEKCHNLIVNCQKEFKYLTDALELRKKGDTLYLHLLAVPKKDNTGALLVIQDTTKEVKILEMRKDFIANASHELKTPITIIRGFAEMLHENPGLPHDTLVEATTKIVRNCHRMEALIRDLLALADIESLPSSRILPFDLMEVLCKSKEITQEIYKDASITILGPKPFMINGDPELIEMAALNLINNAAKYSNPPAQVTVEAYETDEAIVLSVNDKGIGIPEKDLPRLFERFYRVDKARSRQLGGSGLGLSIVQTVVNKHHGDISVTSNSKDGTTFTIKLPKE